MLRSYNMEHKVSAILPAAGSSQRMGTDKLALNAGKKTVLERSLLLLQQNALVSEIVVATRRERIDEVRSLCERNGVTKLRAVVSGGANRFLSVQEAVKACSPDTEFYCIHDAARPFASDAMVTRVIEAAFVHAAAAPCLLLTDTVKVLSADGLICKTPNRDALRSVATPQVFAAALYRECAFGETDAFDDCELLERKGHTVFPVEGESQNIKVTNPGDIERALGLMKEGKLRTGHGYDVHRLVEKRKLILCGVHIPFEKGLLGHSDADVATHAVIDALLGAAAKGDIGALFPDNDDRYKDANSLELLKQSAALLKKDGFVVENVDVTILCQRPKLRLFIDQMRQNLAGAIGIDAGDVSVKATTEEGLGFTGSGEGIAAHAVALVRQLDESVLRLPTRGAL